ncbi:hypothetical protein F4804DRAFT_37620 [Jackrogersella minutella]|nr:hypothetical protein F4804DRAFT_37620 [Jackrogersella minutella]
MERTPVAGGSRSDSPSSAKWSLARIQEIVEALVKDRAEMLKQFEENKLEREYERMEMQRLLQESREQRDSFVQDIRRMTGLHQFEDIEEEVAEEEEKYSTPPTKEPVMPFVTNRPQEKGKRPSRRRSVSETSVTSLFQKLNLEKSNNGKPESDPSDHSDDDKDGKPPKKNRAGSNTPRPDIREKCLLDWSDFDFTLDKENHLKGQDNWVVYHDALKLALEEIGYEDDMILSDRDDLRIAKAITKTCKRQPLDLVTGIRKGSKMLEIFSKTYTTSGKIYQRELWKELSKLKYDGKDPLFFTSRWQLLVRQCRDTGMPIDNQQQITMFFTACEEKAADWVKFTSKLIKAADMHIENIIDDFTTEFRDKQGKNTNANNSGKNNSRNNNAQSRGRGRGQGRGRGRGQGQERGGRGGGRGGRGGKPAWDRELGPLCFNCNEYGHLAKDCTQPKRDDNGKQAGQNNATTGSSSSSPVLKDTVYEVYVIFH